MKKIYESGENYLETILLLKEKKGTVRAVDIVSHLGYSKSSVSRAVNILKTNGYITIDSLGSIDFTEKGSNAATAMYERHRILEEYLLTLGVSSENAENDACRIEHVISEETFEKIKNLVEKK